jgi:hypothetical protein
MSCRRDSPRVVYLRLARENPSSLRAGMAITQLWNALGKIFLFKTI